MTDEGTETADGVMQWLEHTTMPERGGPTTESGISFQNQVAALYLGRLIDPRQRPRYDTLREVRVEAPSPVTVDDIVLRFADGHREFIQTKEAVASGSGAWTKLWQDFATQRGMDRFTAADRITLLLGSHHAWVGTLKDLCDRAAGAGNEDEWRRRLSSKHQRLLEKLEPILTANLGHLSLYSLFACCKVSIWESERIEIDQVPNFMPQSNVNPGQLFDTLLRKVSRHARIRKPFFKENLLNELAKEDIEMLDSRRAPYLNVRSSPFWVLTAVAIPLVVTTLFINRFDGLSRNSEWGDGDKGTAAHLPPVDGPPSEARILPENPPEIRAREPEISRPGDKIDLSPEGLRPQASGQEAGNEDQQFMWVTIELAEPYRNQDVVISIEGKEVVRGRAGSDGVLTVRVLPYFAIAPGVKEISIDVSTSGNKEMYKMAVVSDLDGRIDLPLLLSRLPEMSSVSEREKRSADADQGNGTLVNEGPSEEAEIGRWRLMGAVEAGDGSNVCAALIVSRCVVAVSSKCKLGPE